MKDRRLLKSRMDVLWNPRTVAMVGATNNMMKWGFIILARMLHEGFTGEVYPINPRDEAILGKKAFRSILDVPGQVDLAIISTPAAAVPAVLKECAVKKVPVAIVVTSGFSEVGPEGARFEREIVALATEAGISLVGPNTMGIYSASSKLNCLMSPISPLPGNAACISQSGNVGTHMLYRGIVRGLGFGKFVSSGNEGDLTFEDYLWYFGQDPDTLSVLGYIEGLDPGSNFMEIAPEVTKMKPVILYKGGRTVDGAHAAASHTGAMAGDMEVFRKALKQAGVILADSNKEVVELGRALGLNPPPVGPRIGILTRGGGWGVIATDACVEAGLQVVALSEKTIAGLDKILPSYWSRGNPVDMVAVTSNQAFLDCMELMLEDPGVDAVIALGMYSRAFVTTTARAMRKIGAVPEDQICHFEEAAIRDGDDFLAAFDQMLAATDKPVLSVGLRTEGSEPTDNMMMITEPEDAASMMAKMVEYGRYLRRMGDREI